MTYQYSRSYSSVLTKTGLRQVAFIIMMFVYGFFSTPTPDKVGIPEIIIAVLLLIIFFPKLLNFVSPLLRQQVTFYSIISMFFVFYFFGFSSAYGLIVKQNTLNNFVRDFIPFVYSCIPLLFYDEIKKPKTNWLPILIIGMLIAGTGFIFQFITAPSFRLKSLIISQWYGSNKDNPWQEPSAVFAFSFWGCLLIYSFLYRKLKLFFISLGLYGVFFLVYAMTVSRAPIALSILSMVITSLLLVPRKKKWRRRIINCFLLVFLFSIIVCLNYNLIQSALLLLMKKTHKVGVSNARIVEMKAVVNNIKSLLILLFGEGWGGLIANPIGGGAKWRFVHNMFFYYLFKTGLIGLIGVIIYMMWILKGTWKVAKIINCMHPFYQVAFISLVPPLVVAGLLEPMFKVLTFGILLTIILGFRFQYKRLKYAKP